ncbi:MAG: sigma-54-dependent Fis family transcriptional regulator [Deltaproteobacteria bacterium]|nr:sigma-54-dependent Fis family transcriptional regulator [Deltaproteobacteria bacterium]
MNAGRPILLVVDDKRNMTRLMAKVMKHDADVRTADHGAEALRLLASQPVDVVLCDLKMPDMDGLDVLRACRRLRPEAEFVLMTAYATVGTAVEALKLGAYDYLTKPFEPDAARVVLLRALSRSQLLGPRVADGEEVLPGVLARSREMKALADFVRRVADSDVTTLLLGETGTGKERLARAVHDLSPRSARRFVPINCAAVPAELLESELFGAAKGAFTGAVFDRKGLFEEADGGSLFLDEIGEMRPSLQAKLTRALEERAVRRVGEAKERAVDVRLIAATHRDLESMVRQGTFREDLWYRLNVALVRIPPLRDRRDDIEPLARYFLGQHAERNRGRLIRGLTSRAMDALRTFDWPGNVRQLRSAVERACVVAQGDEVDTADLPPEILHSGSMLEDDPSLVHSTWAQALERGRIDLGRRYFEALMRRFEGQVADAAQAAGVERESFYRLLRKHGVDPGAYRRPGGGSK